MMTSPSSDNALRHSASDIVSSPEDSFNAFTNISQPLVAMKLETPSSKCKTVKSMQFHKKNIVDNTYYIDSSLWT